MIIDITKENYEQYLPAIVTLEQELFPSGAWSEEMFRSELTAPYRSYVVNLEDDGEVSGYAGFFSNGEDAEIMTIAVAKKHQRQGLGRSLLGALFYRAQLQNLTRMLLEVRVDNEPALALYEGVGFERMGVRKHYYQPEDVDAYTMSYEFKPRVVGFTASAGKDEA